MMFNRAWRFWNWIWSWGRCFKKQKWKTFSTELSGRCRVTLRVSAVTKGNGPVATGVSLCRFQASVVSTNMKSSSNKSSAVRRRWASRSHLYETWASRSCFWADIASSHRCFLTFSFAVFVIPIILFEVSFCAIVCFADLSAVATTWSLYDFR